MRRPLLSIGCVVTRYDASPDVAHERLLHRLGELRERIGQLRNAVGTSYGVTLQGTDSTRAYRLVMRLCSAMYVRTDYTAPIISLPALEVPRELRRRRRHGHRLDLAEHALLSDAIVETLAVIDPPDQVLIPDLDGELIPPDDLARVVGLIAGSDEREMVGDIVDHLRALADDLLTRAKREHGEGDAATIGYGRAHATPTRIPPLPATRITPPRVLPLWRQSSTKGTA